MLMFFSYVYVDETTKLLVKLHVNHSVIPIGMLSVLGDRGKSNLLKLLFITIMIIKEEAKNIKEVVM